VRSGGERCAGWWFGWEASSEAFGQQGAVAAEVAGLGRCEHPVPRVAFWVAGVGEDPPSAFVDEVVVP
jgi:hypothetical protein